MLGNLLFGSPIPFTVAKKNGFGGQLSNAGNLK
jgi:hypothetical protein